MKRIHLQFYSCACVYYNHNLPIMLYSIKILPCALKWSDLMYYINFKRDIECMLMPLKPCYKGSQKYESQDRRKSKLFSYFHVITEYSTNNFTVSLQSTESPAVPSGTAFHIYMYSTVLSFSTERLKDFSGTLSGLYRASYNCTCQMYCCSLFILVAMASKGIGKACYGPCSVIIQMKKQHFFFPGCLLCV